MVRIKVLTPLKECHRVIRLIELQCQVAGFIQCVDIRVIHLNGLLCQGQCPLVLALLLQDEAGVPEAVVLDRVQLFRLVRDIVQDLCLEEFQEQVQCRLRLSLTLQAEGTYVLIAGDGFLKRQWLLRTIIVVSLGRLKVRLCYG